MNVLNFFRSRRAIVREILVLRHRLDIANERIDALTEQRDSFRESLQALKLVNVCEGAQAKYVMEMLKRPQ